VSGWVSSVVWGGRTGNWEWGNFGGEVRHGGVREGLWSCD